MWRYYDVHFCLSVARIQYPRCPSFRVVQIVDGRWLRPCFVEIAPSPLLGTRTPPSLWYDAAVRVEILARNKLGFVVGLIGWCFRVRRAAYSVYTFICVAYARLSSHYKSCGRKSCPVAAEKKRTEYSRGCSVGRVKSLGRDV